MRLYRLRRALTVAASAALLIIAVSAGLVLPLSAPAAAVDTTTVGISPTDEPAYFHINLLPGESSERRAVVSNFSAAPVDLLIYPADATVTAQGAFSLADRGAPARNLGAWIHLPVTNLHLAAHNKVVVPFTVTVPAATEPGDYDGGILIQSFSAGRTTDVSQKFPVQVNIVQRVGVRAYLHVGGATVRAYRIGTLTWKQTPDGIRFSVPVTNTGNIRLRPSGTVRVHGVNLPNEQISMNHVEELMPGTTVTLTGMLRHPPSYAYGSATATVDDGEGHRQTVGTSLRLIPVLPTLGILGVLLVLTLCGWWLTRFVLRARKALREVQRRQEGSPGPTPAAVTDGSYHGRHRTSDTLWMSYTEDRAVPHTEAASR